jgi:HAD superfamily hydrolase (TIGR01549 family)
MLEMKGAKLFLQEKQIIFWDFDGVIKDSVTVKSAGYETLFAEYGKKISTKVRQHHEEHGGVSRFEKIPLYLSWAGEVDTSENVQEFCDRFSAIVKQAVIDAPWVPGVREYLLSKNENQRFVLVTATPQDEIEQILQALSIIHCFTEIHGAPKPKTLAVQEVLERLQCSPDRALLVGDSDSDLNAAEANQVPFLLRETQYNKDLQKSYSGPTFEHLNHE